MKREFIERVILEHRVITEGGEYYIQEVDHYANYRWACKPKLGIAICNSSSGKYCEEHEKTVWAVLDGDYLELYYTHLFGKKHAQALMQIRKCLQKIERRGNNGNQ